MISLSWSSTLILHILSSTLLYIHSSLVLDTSKSPSHYEPTCSIFKQTVETGDGDAEGHLIHPPDAGRPAYRKVSSLESYNFYHQVIPFCLPVVTNINICNLLKTYRRNFMQTSSLTQPAPVAFCDQLPDRIAELLTEKDAHLVCPADMTETESATSVKFSENLKTPMEIPPVESWTKDNCKFMERGKVLTKIINETCCLPSCRSTTWRLCYVIRTSDDALIIFTAPEKGFILNLSSAIYLKIARNETSKGKRMCKVKLKWRFGKVKLKFAENQILIWRQRFLSTFGRIGDPNKKITAIILKNHNDKKTELEEEWDTTDSVTSLTGSYTLRSHSSKSSGSFKKVELIPLYPDTEKTDAVMRLSRNIKANESSSDLHKKVDSKSYLATFRKKQLCNCRRLFGFINRNSAQHINKAKIQNKPTKSTAVQKNNCKVDMDYYEIPQVENGKDGAPVSTALQRGRNLPGKAGSMPNSNLALPEPSESNA